MRATRATTQSKPPEKGPSNEGKIGQLRNAETTDPMRPHDQMNDEAHQDAFRKQLDDANGLVQLLRDKANQAQGNIDLLRYQKSRLIAQEALLKEEIGRRGREVEFKRSQCLRLSENCVELEKQLSKTQHESDGWKWAYRGAVDEREEAGVLLTEEKAKISELQEQIKSIKADTWKLFSSIGEQPVTEGQAVENE